jgi:hypothetical protein
MRWEVTCLGCLGHRKLDTVPFLAGSCGVYDHACLQTGFLSDEALQG